ncbi:2-oxo-4-hydroxy-4-carboxy-5-ureidoimidazoline decarboxylase [Jatrophihabitans sp. DSM 45814]
MTTANAGGPIDVGEFDAAPPADAAAELVPCCASRRWVSRLVKNRPYASLSRLSSASDGVLAALPWPDLLEALPEHSAEHPYGAESRAAVGMLSMGAYRDRFGYAFVICSAGLTEAQVMVALRSRLRNDPVAEREVVRAELAKLVRLRLASAFR